MKIKIDPLTRFMNKAFIQSNGCWSWIGCRNRKGYGEFGIAASKSMLAHRWIYEYYNGPLGNSLCLHSCNNSSCVNPDHLEAGTYQQNAEYCVKSGNNKNANKDFCPKGHPYDIANTRISNGRRKCRACGEIEARNAGDASHRKRKIIKIN